MDAECAASAPVVRRVRAYFAPVNRAAGAETIFDPAQLAGFTVDSPPLPWVDLGWVRGFSRKSGTKIEPIRTGAPAVVETQVRTEVDATVSLAFETWGKLQLTLACGTQQMNVLAASGATAAGSGGAAAAAVPVLDGSSATALMISDGGDSFAAGSTIVVDTDYGGAIGYVGVGVSGGYARAGITDVDYVRRVSNNLAVVATVTEGTLALRSPLPAGTPASTMKVSSVVGFCDREGSTFFQEWAALFVMEGQQGERILLHYPRLQTATGIEETLIQKDGMNTVRLEATFRALPVVDATDGERVVCFRSYIPAA